MSEADTGAGAGAGAGAAEHWDRVYAVNPPETVSWFQEDPGTSLRLLTAAGDPAMPVIDVGAGRSPLAAALLAAGWSDVTVLDVSVRALEQVVAQLADYQEALTLVVADLLDWTPTRSYRAWHDRAVFHFLVEQADRAGYVATARRAVAPGGALVLGTFALEGPTSCSGLAAARYDASGLAQEFAPDFVLERAETEQHATPAGTIQPFTWVVLRRAGRRPTVRTGAPSA